MKTIGKGAHILSNHAARRAARRNVKVEALEYVLTYGRCIQRTGVTFYFLGRDDLPPADRHASWASRLEGTVVLMGNDGEIITVYRQRNALPTIRRKLKYRIEVNGNQTIGRLRSPGRQRQIAQVD